MERISACRTCGCHDIQPFFDLGPHALANSLAAPGEPIDPKYPLELAFCPQCRLVQLLHTPDPKRLFSDYVWVTGTSSTAGEYAETFCDRALEKLGKKPTCVLEIASNDGTFLRPFRRRGIKVIGIDPAANIVRGATRSGIPTVCDFFGLEAARTLVSEHGYPDLVIARNVLPHVADIHDVVDGLSAVLDGDGLLVVEVHWARDISANLHYDSIYHEHLCYFTLLSLSRLLALHGIHIYDLAYSPISGGSIVSFASTKESAPTKELEACRRTEEEGGVNTLENWRKFADDSRRHRELLINLLLSEKDEGRSVIGYGASARSSTLLSYADIGTDLIPVIADQNPGKQGLMTAGSRIPITSPEQAMATRPETVVVLAWNFLHEIAEILKSRYGFDGRLIIPLPGRPRAATIEEVCRG